MLSRSSSAFLLLSHKCHATGPGQINRSYASPVSGGIKITRCAKYVLWEQGSNPSCPQLFYLIMGLKLISACLLIVLSLIVCEPIIFAACSDQCELSHLLSAHLLQPSHWPPLTSDWPGLTPGRSVGCVMPRCLFSRRPMFTQTGSREIVKIITGRHRGGEAHSKVRLLRMEESWKNLIVNNWSIF